MELKKAPALIPSLDVSIAEAGTLVQKLSSVEDKIAAYKVSSLHALEAGLKAVVAELRNFTSLPLIYDHQKGSTDIPAIAARQVEAAAHAGINSFIAVPLGAGGETLKSFVEACKTNEILPIVLLEMTHPGANDFLHPQASQLVFERAFEAGVRHFVAPGNKPESIQQVRAWARDAEVFIVSPGIGIQGGGAETAVAAGTDYPIVGRAIYGADDPVAAVNELYDQSVKGFGKR